MKYMKTTREIREKNEIPKRKLHLFQCSFFFNRSKPPAKVTLIFRLNFAYNSYESLLKKKVLIYKAISGTDNAYCGSKLWFPSTFYLMVWGQWYYEVLVRMEDSLTRFWSVWQLTYAFTLRLNVLSHACPTRFASVSSVVLFSSVQIYVEWYNGRNFCHSTWSNQYDSKWRLSSGHTKTI